MELGYILFDASDIRLIECIIKDNGLTMRRYYKKLPFAWIVERTLVQTIKPVVCADQDFYSSVLDKLGKIITNSFEFASNEIRTKIIEVYISLLKIIEKDVKENIQQTEADELVYQQLMEKYKFFLSPSANKIEGNRAVDPGKKRYDFRAETNDDVIYVEIEPPQYKPFEGDKISSRLNGALVQVEDWKRILSGNPSTKKIQFIIVIGLTSDLGADERSHLQDFNRTQTDLSVVTWDWFVEQINRTTKELEKQLKC